MTTMGEMLLSTVLQHRERVVFPDAEGGGLTYGGFLTRVKHSAGLLRSMGMKAGDRFAIIASNCLEAAELMYAGYWSGIIPVPVNVRLAPPEIRHVLEDSEAYHLFVDEKLSPLLNEKDLIPWHNGVVTIRSKEPERDYRNLSDKAEPVSLYPSDPDGDALLLYTGGTTGKSKGVRLTHRNILSDALQCAPVLAPRREEIYLHAAPMFHSADLLGTIWFLFGAGHVFLPAFSPQNLLETIARFRITFAMLPPTMIIMSLQIPDFNRYDLSSLRGLIYGASPMPEEWIRQLHEALPQTEIYQGYGLTETSPLLTILSWQAHQEALFEGRHERLKSCGRPLVGVELKITGEGGKSVPYGEAGDVIVRASNVMKGYLKRETETEEAFQDGWFHTGDIGKMDEEGFLYLLDRKKDMVISGGENIYTSEVEEVLHKYPGLQEAAVIGVPDEKYGETPLAVIVPKVGTRLSADEIIEYCRGKIGGYKIPRRFVFVDALPKSALGKVLKTDLRRMYSN